MVWAGKDMKDHGREHLHHPRFLTARPCTLPGMGRALTGSVIMKGALVKSGSLWSYLLCAPSQFPPKAARELPSPDPHFAFPWAHGGVVVLLGTNLL